MDWAGRLGKNGRRWSIAVSAITRQSGMLRDCTQKKKSGDRRCVILKAMALSEGHDNDGIEE
jgi:hypothetical protein